MHSGRDMRDDHRAVPAAARRALSAASAGGKDLTGARRPINRTDHACRLVLCDDGAC